MRTLLAISDRRSMNAGAAGVRSGHRPALNANDPYSWIAELNEQILALARALGPKLIVMLREKELDAGPLFQWADQLQPKLQKTGARLMINGRADVALALEDVGLHLPGAGLPILHVRAARALFSNRVVGASCHTEDELLEKAVHGADLLTLSPIFSSPGKGPPLGLRALERAVSRLRASYTKDQVKIFALGGINEENAELVWGTGVDGIAAIRAAWSTPPARLGLWLGL